MIQEATYGFIMALTFVISARLGLVSFSSRSALIGAIVAMDFVWGAIDMYIFYRVDKMSQDRRIELLRRIYSSDDRERYRQELGDDLEEGIVGLTSDETKHLVENTIMGGSPEPWYEVRSDRRRYAFNAVTAFVVTLLTAVPAAICLTFIEDDTLAYLSTSVVSSLALFFTGYRLSPLESRTARLWTGATTAAIALVLTVFAAYLGG